MDGFAVKIEEWVDRSRGRIRADVAHQRLVAMGWRGAGPVDIEAEIRHGADRAATDPSAEGEPDA